MCGVIGAFYTGKEPRAVNDWVIAQYEDQYGRGQKGFGIITIGNNKKVKVERSCEPYKFLIDLKQVEAQHIIVHHRTPTSSDNKIAQTHPIVVDNGSLKYKYLIVHNGIIRNEDELKPIHEALGFVYTTDIPEEYKFNDSEALAIELSRYIEDQIKEIDIQGTFAFIVLQVNKKTNKAVKLYFGRDNTNPLNIAKTRNQMLLSSEGPGEEVKEFTLYNCVLEGEMKLHKRKLKVKEEVIEEKPLTPVKHSFSSYYNSNKIHDWSSFKKDKDPTKGDTAVLTVDDYSDTPVYDELEFLKDSIISAVEDYCEAGADKDGIHFCDQLKEEIITACNNYKEGAEQINAQITEDKEYALPNTGGNPGLCGFTD